MKKAGKILINLFIYVVIVVTVVFGLPRALSWALDTPFPMAAITSGSMWPALNQGDLVIIQGVSRDALKEGDIIVYRNPKSNAFTIHRIVNLGEDMFTTKGDANFNADEPVPYENLVGRAFKLFGRIVHVPYLGSITVFAGSVK